LLWSRKNTSDSNRAPEKKKIWTVGELPFSDAREGLFDRVEILLPHVNVAKRQDAVFGQVSGGNFLIG
jgi:hypothetical protein